MLWVGLFGCLDSSPVISGGGGGGRGRRLCPRWLMQPRLPAPARRRAKALAVVEVEAPLEQLLLLQEVLEGLADELLYVCGGE